MKPISSRIPPDRSRAPAPGAMRPFEFPSIERAAIGNGLELLVLPSRALPVVTASLLLPAGGVAEPMDCGGLAALVADLLESGTERRDAAQMAQAVEAMGVSVSVRPQWDWTQIGITALRHRLRETLELLAELVTEPTFPEAEVSRLRAERIAEIAQSRADPGGLADERVLDVIFSERSPFHRPLGGVPETVTAVDRAGAVAFHSTRYRPHGATLIGTGDLATDELVGIAEQVFGLWSGAAAAASPITVEPAVRRAGPVFVDIPGAAQSEIRMGHIGVERCTPDFFPLLVMNAILGGMFSSRLNLNLRERHGFTYGVSSAWTMRRQPGPFVISTAVQTDRTAAAVEEILNEVRDMRENPPRSGELDAARSYLAGVFPLTLQTTDGLAARLGAVAGYGLPLDFYDHYRERIMDVTGQDVLRVAREYLRPESLATVIVGDAGTVRGQFSATDAAGRGGE